MSSVLRRASCVALLATLCLGVVPNAAAQTLDRSKQPVAGPAPAPRFPDIQIRKLSNGITVAVVEDHEIPAVQVRAVVGISPLPDPSLKDGIAEITASMLSEGTTTMTADQIATAAGEIGTPVTPLRFYTINRHVDRALGLMADQLMRPAFPQAALDRVKGNRVTALRRSKTDAAYLAGRVFANVVYGTGHPFERSATEESVGSITREDVQAFYTDYYRPQNVSFVVGGDITADAAVAKLERVFGSWTAGGKPGMPTVHAPRGVDTAKIYLYDIPGSSQTLIFMGQLGPARDTPDFFPLRLANAVLGASTGNRLNRALRRQGGLTYSVVSNVQYRRTPQRGAISITSRVQTSRTDSAVAEIVRTVKEIGGSRPLTAEELDYVQTSQMRALPRAFETVTQKVDSAATLLSTDLPLDYYRTLAAGLGSVTLASAQAAAARHIDFNRMAIVLVGDRKQIEEPIRRLGIAPVVVVDERGKPVP